MQSEGMTQNAESVRVDWVLVAYLAAMHLVTAVAIALVIQWLN